MSAAEPTPSSRRERPAKPALTLAGIVGAALEVMRAEGLERVTMRRLATELDTGPASLYVYVRNTAELRAFMLDDLLGGLDLTPVTAGGSRRGRLITVLWSYTVVLVQHPGLAYSALVTRPSGPGYLRLLDGLLALLRAEFGDDRAVWAVDLLLHFATATAAEQGTRRQAFDVHEEEDKLIVAIRGAAATTYPNIAAVGMDLLSGEGADRLTWAFDVLISGILATPRPDPST